MERYWPFAVLVLWFSYKFYQSQRIRRLLPELRRRGALLLDVRSSGEFDLGHAPETLNIPLHELKDRLGEIPRGVPVVVCCASGTRSGMAAYLLKRQGIGEVYNIGPWTRLK